MEISVKSSFKLDLPPHLIISSSSIKLLETFGQGSYYICSVNRVVCSNDLNYVLGEFGIVYKGYIIKGNTKAVDEYLAIKTLKGVYYVSKFANN